VSEEQEPFKDGKRVPLIWPGGCAPVLRDWRQPYLDWMQVCGLLGWYGELEVTQRKLAEKEKKA